MTREIKFRGKKIDTGEWVYGNYAFSSVNGKHQITVETLDGCKHYYVYHPVNPETVGQYTGLKDKNGNEIYEGDIVQWGTEDEILSCVVEYTEGAHDSEECPYMSGFSYRVIDAIDYPEDDEGETDYVTEVIGNIYDNPELLEEAK
ncbi:YopX family protein [Dehalococcoides sp.]|jgi:uncharacterized phage protein (TIGR01671 family)|uniref:YopX family protein n=1 Tax=Dehalococcoides sp. TaxID=1966486 RepID=UPI0035685B2A